MSGRLPQNVRHFLAKRAVQGPWQLAGTDRHDFTGAVVIPALAEGDSLFTTLASLSRNPPERLSRWLTVVVINQREDAATRDRAQNQADLSRIAREAQSVPFPLTWVDATSRGQELPAREGGVGLARKLGMDLVLPYLDWSHVPLLACLDADTLVEPTYLQALDEHFQHNDAGAAVLPFRHQPVDDPVQQQAIDRYELFLRSYVHGLELARSPYAFATIGSALACTATAYVKSGGMNRRTAAEDFHFLDKLAKTVGVTRLQGTCVHPSPRASHRVPFGTGQSIARQLSGEHGVVRFYPVTPFQILGHWLESVERRPDLEAEALLGQARMIAPRLAEFLIVNGWRATWPRLQQNHAGRKQRLRAFHAWFDGLKTLRLIHALCDDGYPRSACTKILKAYLPPHDQDDALTVAALLARLRRHQEAVECALSC
jgi:hypothetical protein